MLKEIIKAGDSEASLNPERDTGCEKCGGFGMVHPKRSGVIIYSELVPCVCLKKEIEVKRQAALLRGCELPPFAEIMTFERFEVYPEVKLAYKECLAIAKKPGELFWLALIGENDNGKTHLAISIIREWLKAGIPAKYTFVSLLLDELREGFRHDRGDDYENSYERKFEYYKNVPLLLLDDYGVESSTAWVQEKLDTIVDYRLMHNLSLLITSNLTLDEMPGSIRSRIMRHPRGQIIAITAGDFSLRGKR